MGNGHQFRMAGASAIAMMMAMGGSALAQQATAAQRNTGLAEVVVTASRRAVNLQKESRTVSVISAQELVREGVNDPVQIQNLVPGVQVARNGLALQVFVNGIGDRAITAASDPAVSLNVDGLYYPKSYESTGFVYDLASIEVLKGPQGTLWGRNSTAGAVNLITAKPQFTKGPTGFIELELGNYADKRVTGAVNQQLTDQIAVRLAGQVIDRNGYLSDGYDDDKEQSGRLEVLYRPDDQQSLLLTGAFAHLGGRGDSSTLYPYQGGNPWAGTSSAPVLAWLASHEAGGPGSYNIPTANGFQNINTSTVTADYERNLGFAQLSVLPSYLTSTAPTLQYVAPTVPVYERTASNQSSLELRLASLPGARVKWVGGVIGSYEHSTDLLESNVGPGFVLVSPTSARNDSTVAVFGEATVPVTDKFRVTGGVRGTWEEKKQTGFTTAVFGVSVPVPVAAMPSTGINDGGEKDYRAVNFRAGLEYDVLPQSMAYATFATGFKAGGFYVDAPPNAYKPERLTAYTVGIKNRFFDNRLQLNVEGFYWDFKNEQEIYLGIANANALGFVLKTVNAGSVSIDGASVSLIGRLTDSDTLSFDGEYLHSKYNSFTIYTVGLGGAPVTGCGATTANNFNYTVNCAGQSLIRAPEWSGRVTFDHQILMASGASVDINLGTRFSSSYWSENDFVPLERSPSYAIGDLSVAYSNPGNRYTVTAFVNNIGNTAYITGSTAPPGITSNQGGAIAALMGAPRTFGARLRVNF